MNKHPIEPYLSRMGEVKLPECEFCKTTRCRDCIHFEAWAPDSKGQCRCAYRGRWYYPHEGCTNGSPDPPPPDPIPIPQPTPTPQPTPRPTPRRTPSGAGAGLLFLAILVGAFLFSVGILKTTATFTLSGINAPTVAAGEYGISLVRMDDGSNSYPKDFSNYTVDSAMFNENGSVELTLDKGGYHYWISRSGISGYADRIDNNSFLGVFGINFTADTTNIGRASMFVVHLTVRDSSGVPAEQPLIITDAEGKPLDCTRLGDAGHYILILPDWDATRRIHQITIRLEGCISQTLELDFTDSRTIHESIRFKKN